MSFMFESTPGSHAEQVICVLAELRCSGLYRVQVIHVLAGQGVKCPALHHNFECE